MLEVSCLVRLHRNLLKNTLSTKEKLYKETILNFIIMNEDEFLITGLETSFCLKNSNNYQIHSI